MGRRNFGIPPNLCAAPAAGKIPRVLSMSSPADSVVRREIEALVPVYDSPLAAFDTVSALLGSRSLSSIIVSVNHPGASKADFLRLRALDPRIKVYLQQSDLGLYGNLRFLSKVSSKPWLVFCAVDDFLPPQIIDKLAGGVIPEDTNLVVFQQRLSKQVRDCNGRYSATELSHLVHDRDIPHGSKVMCDPLEGPPSWIFGLWRASYIRAIFPRTDFNWLDTYLVSRALSEDSVAHFEADTPALIGFVEGRPPHAVGSSWRTPFGWFFHMAFSRRVTRKTGYFRLVSDWRMRLFFKHSTPRTYRVWRSIHRVLGLVGRRVRS